MRWQGVANLTKITNAALDTTWICSVAWTTAEIWRGFEPTPTNRQRYASVRLRPVPVKIAWSEADPALKISVDGKRARAAAGFDQIHRLPGKHISFREDQAPTLADLITRLFRA